MDQPGGGAQPGGGGGHPGGGLNRHELGADTDVPAVAPTPLLDEAGCAATSPSTVTGPRTEVCAFARVIVGHDSHWAANSPDRAT